MSLLVGNYCKYIAFGDVILTLLVVITQALLLNGAMILSFTLIKIKRQMKSMLNSRKIYGTC